MKDTKLLILLQKFDITDLRFHLLKMSVSMIRKLASIWGNKCNNDCSNYSAVISSILLILHHSSPN
jgi:hypothetical protein